MVWLIYQLFSLDVPWFNLKKNSGFYKSAWGSIQCWIHQETPTVWVSPFFSSPGPLSSHKSWRFFWQFYHSCWGLCRVALKLASGQDAINPEADLRHTVFLNDVSSAKKTNPATVIDTATEYGIWSIAPAILGQTKTLNIRIQTEICNSRVDATNICSHVKM